MVSKLLRNLWSGSYLKITRVQSVTVVIHKAFHMSPPCSIFVLKGQV